MIVTDATGQLFTDRRFRALIGLDWPEQSNVTLEVLSQRSRNTVFRLTCLESAESVIVKIVRKSEDPFWEHHLRREHWLLRLLERFWQGGSPRPVAVGINRAWGFLAMEDLQAPSLAELASSLPRESLSGAIALGLQILASLHGALAEHDAVFRRVIASIHLDEVTEEALRARFCVALSRLFRLDDRSGTAIWERGGRLHESLLTEPLQIIHNSCVPLNVLVDQRAWVIDWETAAVGALEWDLADLVFFPPFSLGLEDTLEIVRSAYDRPWNEQRLLLAALLRSLDYAASTEARAARSSDPQGEEHQRSLAYLRQARDLALRFGWREVVELANVPAADTRADE
ncbi:MAG: aminoglycoside phosphotransferase family protein [Chloroflexi bacterium]|nr:aminoglycoside phosphotransferase family protein [Chloroflexota bacterium]